MCNGLDGKASVLCRGEEQQSGFLPKYPSSTCFLAPVKLMEGL